MKRLDNVLQQMCIRDRDISCVGRCSLTAVLPLFSAAGIECSVLPTALLSTHTGGFGQNTFLDLTGQMAAILEHWQREGIVFDALCTGYLGAPEPVSYTHLHPHRLLITQMRRRKNKRRDFIPIRCV